MIDEQVINAVMEYLENQDGVRDRLRKVYGRINRPNFSNLAWEIGISPVTLNAFLKGNRKVELRILWSIDCWVRKEESLDPR